MPDSQVVRKPQFSIQGGAPSAYEILGLPLWTRDSQQILAMCRAKIEELRLRGGIPQQLQQQIAELLRARDILTSPGARAEYNEQLRAELIERAEREEPGFDEHSVRNEQRTEFDSSSANVKTLMMPQSRAAAATLRLSCANANPLPSDSERLSTSSAQQDAKETQPKDRELERSPRDFGVAALRFVVAVALTAFAINLAFFHQNSMSDKTTSDTEESNQPLPSLATATGNTDSLPFELTESVKVVSSRPAADATQPAIKLIPPAIAKPRSDDAAAVEQPNHKAIAAVVSPKKLPPKRLPVPLVNPVVAVTPVAGANPGPAAFPLNTALRPLPQMLNPNERREYAKQIRDMLYEGFSSGKEAFQRSTTLYEQAKSHSAVDPRLHYGYGLVLWRRLKHTDAVERIEKAAETDAFYWPAQQALICLKLTRNQHDAGFDMMADMANRLQQRRADTITDDDRHAAYWLGRLMSFLRQPDNQVHPDLRRVEIIQRLVERRFRDELLDAFKAGERRLNDEYSALVTLSKQSLKKEAARAAERSAEKVKSLEKRLELQEDRQENVARTARDWQQWIEKQTAEADKQLNDLAAQFRSAQAQARAYRLALMKIDRDYVNLPNILEQLMRLPSKRMPVVRIVDPNPFKRMYGLQPVPIDSYSATRVHYEAQYDRLDAEAASIQLRAVQVVNRRSQAVARFQQATGLLVNKSDSLRNWETILEKQKDSIEKKQASHGSSFKAKSILRKARALSTYVAFNPALERQRILDSLPAD